VGEIDRSGNRPRVSKSTGGWVALKDVVAKLLEDAEERPPPPTVGQLDFDGNVYDPDGALTSP
jgi:hypothetical protein